MYHVERWEHTHTHSSLASHSIFFLDVSLFHSYTFVDDWIIRFVAAIAVSSTRFVSSSSSLSLPFYSFSSLVTVWFAIESFAMEQFNYRVCTGKKSTHQPASEWARVAYVCALSKTIHTCSLEHTRTVDRCSSRARNASNAVAPILCAIFFFVFHFLNDFRSLSSLRERNMNCVTARKVHLVCESCQIVAATKTTDFFLCEIFNWQHPAAANCSNSKIIELNCLSREYVHTEHIAWTTHKSAEWWQQKNETDFSIQDEKKTTRRDFKVCANNLLHQKKVKLMNGGVNWFIVYAWLSRGENCLTTANVCKQSSSAHSLCL